MRHFEAVALQRWEGLSGATAACHSWREPQGQLFIKVSTRSVTVSSSMGL